MKTLEELKKAPELRDIKRRPDGTHTACVKLDGRAWVAAWDMKDGMEYAAVSCTDLSITPSEEQKSILRDIFFYPEEIVFEFNPETSKLENCLHMWRVNDWNNIFRGGDE